MHVCLAKDLYYVARAGIKFQMFQKLGNITNFKSYPSKLVMYP